MFLVQTTLIPDASYTFLLFNKISFLKVFPNQMNNLVSLYNQCPICFDLFLTLNYFICTTKAAASILVIGSSLNRHATMILTLLVRLASKFYQINVIQITAFKWLILRLNLLTLYLTLAAISEIATLTCLEASILIEELD